METEKIELRKEREFGDVFNATFAFIKQEFNPLGKALLVCVVPVIILVAIAMVYIQSAFLGNAFKGVTPGSMPNISGLIGPYLLLFLLMILMQVMTSCTVLSYINLRLKNIEITGTSEILEEIQKHFFPILGASLLTFIVMAVGFMFCILPGIYLGISLSLILPAVVFEGKGVGDAFSRSFQLTHMQWWWTFLMLFVIIILLYITTLILQIPGMIMGITSLFTSIKNHDSNPFEKFGTTYIVYTSIVSAISYLFYIIPHILMAFQYFNLVETREKASLINKIDEI